MEQNYFDINNEINDFNETDLEYEFIFKVEDTTIETNNSIELFESIDIKKYFLKLFNESANSILSKLTPKQIMENSNYLEIYKKFENDVCQILNYIRLFDTNNKATNILKKGYLARFVNLTCFMRDVKGRENTLLSYCLLYFLWKYNSKLSECIFDLFVNKYGSWKDVKKFYRFITTLYNSNDNENIINFIITFTNHQLLKDMLNYDTFNYDKISLASKWVPREKTEYNKLYEMLACNYFSYYFIKNKKQSAINKANMNYRKILSTLNKKLDTVQIKQCGKKWCKINPETQTIATMKLQTNAFLNLTLKKQEKYELADRIICANNFKEYSIEKNKNMNNENMNNENTNNENTNNIILTNYDELFTNYLDNKRYSVDYKLYSFF